MQKYEYKPKLSISNRNGNGKSTPVVQWEDYNKKGQ